MILSATSCDAASKVGWRNGLPLRREERWAVSLLNKRVRDPHNVRFGDFCQEAERLGFALKRTKGSHRTCAREGVPEILTLSPGRSGKAVPAQIRKLRNLLRQYDLDHT